jgi:hypothetical protein
MGRKNRLTGACAIVRHRQKVTKGMIDEWSAEYRPNCAHLSYALRRSDLRRRRRIRPAEPLSTPHSDAGIEAVQQAYYPA